MSQTLAIIKPDAAGNGRTGQIIAQLESAGFTVKAARMVTMTRAQAESFYDVHRERPFYESLVAFMTSGPCVPIALEAPDAVRRLRDVIGATDPAEADPGTVRALHAESAGPARSSPSSSPCRLHRQGRAGRAHGS